jgi:hypothetical protein
MEVLPLNILSQPRFARNMFRRMAGMTLLEASLYDTFNKSEQEVYLLNDSRLADMVREGVDFNEALMYSAIRAIWADGEIPEA